MRLALLLLPLLAGCASVPRAAMEEGAPIFHYVRSNQDGSEPEHVVHYRPSRETVAVYKWVSKCTTAAYVTAFMNPDVTEARRYVAGKVGRDGGQQVFGDLILDGAGPALVVRLDPPGGQPVAKRHPLRSRPYVIYDFDFADLNAFVQERRTGARFSYELPVIWPGEPSLFRDLGKLHARFERDEAHRGRATRRFALQVDGPTPATGTLWLDSAQGFIVEAVLGLPNHDDYRDFRLRLERVERGSDAAWRSLTASHYAGCPTGN